MYWLSGPRPPIGGAKRSLLRAVLAFVIAAPSAAQEPPRTITIEEAVRIARGNNPGFQATRNDVEVDDWNVKSAYGALYSPSISVSGGVSWRGSGDVQLGTLTSEQLGFANQPSFLFSDYGLNINYSLNGRTLMAPGQAKANRRATRARIGSAEADLVLRVTQAYLEVLRQREASQLARQELERARYNLRLAQGQLEVGTASTIDVRQAEVAVGRAEVGVLQAETAEATARLRFLQELGLDLEQDFELATTFSLSAPTWTKEELFAQALEANPGLHALRAQEEAATYGVKMARSSYFPSLSLGASFSGFTREATSTDFAVAQARAQAESRVDQCEALNEIFRRLADPIPAQDCGQFRITNGAIEQIRSENDAFPFDFTSQPAQVFLNVSLPVFQGLSRQRELEAAQVQREDVRHQLREQEIALRVNIAAGLATVRTAYRTAVLEERNQEVAAEQLRLARERYQLGSASFLELVEAETVKAQADRERVAAVFAYHDAVASLEAVVGAALRESTSGTP